MSVTMPIPGRWYRLPDGETFRVITIDQDDDCIEVQYSDGASEVFDEELWQKLSAFELESDTELEQALDAEFQELDFMDLGVAPGTEAYDPKEYEY